MHIGLTSVIVLALAPWTGTVAPVWELGPDVPVPPGATGATLHDVAAASPTAIWTVGEAWPGIQPLAARWNGQAWTDTALPVPKPFTTHTLHAVDALPDGTAWAAGSAHTTSPDGPVTTTMIIFYKTGWAAISSPSTTGIDDVSELFDIDMFSSSDGWAVGGAAVGGLPPQALIQRWTGGRWVKVTLPAEFDAFTQSELHAVHARASDDVWAAGTAVGRDGRRTGLIVHWDGTAWKRFPLPATGTPPEGTVLEDITSVSAKDVWAAGSTCLTEAGFEICHPVVLHVTAKGVQAVPTAGDGAELTAVVALAADDVWVFGYDSNVAKREADHVEHWDGTAFTRDDTIPVPTEEILDGEVASALGGATAVPGTGALWAVGWDGVAPETTPHVIHRG
ncbi:hypothetical protein [Catenuloplanes japonicus]|uniref:hypothetical protein n=1 Tax=Catenuloplanes japonicus TaxID=33876 RepID=UPI0005272182|nr:hypothetical protein [Catenuloplanes japonicus]